MAGGLEEGVVLEEEMIRCLFLGRVCGGVGGWGRVFGSSGFSSSGISICEISGELTMVRSFSCS